MCATSIQTFQPHLEALSDHLGFGTASTWVSPNPHSLSCVTLTPLKPISSLLILLLQFHLGHQNLRLTHHQQSKQLSAPGSISQHYLDYIPRPTLPPGFSGTIQGLSRRGLDIKSVATTIFFQRNSFPLEVYIYYRRLGKF